jgi:hypothetical protein
MNAAATAIVTDGKAATAASAGGINLAVSLAFLGTTTLTPSPYQLCFSTDSAAVLQMETFPTNTVFTADYKILLRPEQLAEISPARTVLQRRLLLQRPRRVERGQFYQLVMPLILFGLVLLP